MLQLYAVDSQLVSRDENGPQDIVVRLYVGSQGAAAIQPQFRGRAYLPPTLDQFSPSTRVRGFRVFKKRGSTLTDDEFEDLVWRTFDPEKGERTLTARRDPADSATEYQALAVVTSFAPGDSEKVFEGQFEFPDPYWYKVAAEEFTASPFTVGGNATTRPTITITEAAAVTRHRVNLKDRSGGFAGWPQFVPMSGADSNCHVFIGPLEAPYAVVDGGLVFRAAGTPFETTKLDIYTGGSANPNYANQLDAGGLNLGSIAGGVVEADPSGAINHPGSAALTWVRGVTAAHGESRAYDYGIQGDTIILMDREATGEKVNLANDADSLVIASPVPFTKISGLDLTARAGYRPGVADPQTAGGERVMRVTITDIDGGFPSLPTNPDFYQHPDSRHPDVPYYAQFSFGEMTFPDTRAVNNQRTLDLDGEGNVVGSFEGWEPVGGTFMRRNEWLDDYLPNELPELAERFIGCEVTQGAEGVYYLHFPDDAFRGMDLPLLSMTIQPKSGEFIQASIIEPLRTVISIDDIGEATTEPILLYESVWVDPATLEPLDGDAVQALAGQVKVVGRYLPADGDDWVTAFSRTITAAGPSGSDQTGVNLTGGGVLAGTMDVAQGEDGVTVTIEGLSFNTPGAVAIAIGLEPAAANPNRVDWGELEFASTPKLHLDTSKTPSVTVQTVDAQEINGVLRNVTTGETLTFERTFSDAGGLVIDTATPDIYGQEANVVKNAPLPSGGSRMFDLPAGQVEWEQTFEGTVTFEVRERLAI